MSYTTGVNDNNFNKQKFPSNIFPPQGGYMGNPNGRYNPITTTFRPNHNFDQTFKENTAVIERMDYANRGTTVHNNINDVVLDEHIVEYRVNIDSLDRDIKTYPDPFSFVVKFNPVSNGIVRTEVLKKGVFTTINEYFQGAPGPHIEREFRNVKYVKLDTIVLPQAKKFISPDENTDDGIDEYSRLLDDRFVQLVVKELTEDSTGMRIYNTSDDSVRYDTDGAVINPPQPFGLIFPDKLMGRLFYTGTPYYSARVYNSSQLGNIKQLTIQFYDSVGKLLKVDGLFTYQELKKRELEGRPVPISDPRHPLYRNTQVHLSFIIGVVESQIANITKYER
jgi:hypothetical protein